jgi:hypothetical protein
MALIDATEVVTEAVFPYSKPKDESLPNKK